MIQHVLSVLRIDQGGAMGQQDHVGFELSRNLIMELAQLGGLLKLATASIAGSPPTGDAGVEDKDVGRCITHEFSRVLLVECVTDG